MGIYLNPLNKAFNETIHREIYVDKTTLIDAVNYHMEKINKYICFSRPRRFGKSTDAQMLVAYYSKGCDSKALFENFKVKDTESYEKHLNQHNVIHIDMQKFLSRA